MVRFPNSINEPAYDSRILAKPKWVPSSCSRDS